MNSRLRRLQKRLRALSLDALLITNPYNISYLADYKCRDAHLVLTAGEAVYITDGRYLQEMKRSLKGVRVLDYKPSFSGVISSICEREKIKRLGFEGQELSYSFHQRLSKAISPVEMVPFSGELEALRRIKDDSEIARIRTAADISVCAYRFIKEFIQPGMKEIEIAGEIERFIRFEGATCASFDIIVASGPGSALPHYQTSERKLKESEPVMIDMGVEYKGYKSDLTRVFFLGKINTLVSKVYSIVRSAQEAALAVIKPGIQLSKVDETARKYISSKGYGKYFMHSLGHGIGLEVHEDPTLSPKIPGVLRPGMVFTVEPGIYLPGKFGIRIEDMVLVTSKGCEVLSGSLDK